MASKLVIFVFIFVVVYTTKQVESIACYQCPEEKECTVKESGIIERDNCDMCAYSPRPGASHEGILLGSNQAIMCVDFDSDEQHILGTSNDFATRVWTLSDKRLRHTLTGHSGKVLAGRFMGDGKIVSGSADRTLKVWDLRQKACVKTIFAGSSCHDLVCSGSLGTNIISGHFDRRIRFWDCRTDTSNNEMNLGGRITSLDLSLDQFNILSSLKDDSVLKIIDLRMNQVSATLTADGFHIGADYVRAGFSPDNRYVVCGSGDGTLFVWDALKSRVEQTLSRDHSACILAASWSTRGDYVTSVDKQRRCVLWS